PRWAFALMSGTAHDGFLHKGLLLRLIAGRSRWESVAPNGSGSRFAGGRLCVIGDTSGGRRRLVGACILAHRTPNDRFNAVQGLSALDFRGFGVCELHQV